MESPTDPDRILERPLICVFAYEGATWKTIADEINRQNAWATIDVISILNRGVMFKDGLWFEATDDQLCNIVNGEAAALGMLYFFLTTFATSFIARNVSVRPYFEPFLQWGEDGKWLAVNSSD